MIQKLCPHISHEIITYNHSLIRKITLCFHPKRKKKKNEEDNFVLVRGPYLFHLVCAVHDECANWVHWVYGLRNRDQILFDLFWILMYVWTLKLYQQWHHGLIVNGFQQPYFHLWRAQRLPRIFSAHSLILSIDNFKFSKNLR